MKGSDLKRIIINNGYTIRGLAIQLQADENKDSKHPAQWLHALLKSDDVKSSFIEKLVKKQYLTLEQLYGSSLGNFISDVDNSVVTIGNSNKISHGQNEQLLEEKTKKIEEMEKRIQYLENRLEESFQIIKNLSSHV